MAFFDFLKRGAKPHPPKNALPAERVEADMGKTIQLKKLFGVPKEKRDDSWRDAFYQNVQMASLASADPEVFTGPDGFSYFALTIPAEGKPFESFCIQNLKVDLLEKGLGVVINNLDGTTEWVFTYGNIVNLHINNEFISEKDNADFNNIEMTKKVEVIKKGEDVMMAQPSAAYLPYPSREALKKFLQRTGIEKPMIMMMCRKKEGHMLQELGFNIHPEDFSSEEECNYRMYQIGWFLPSHYLIISFPRQSAMSKHFSRL